ncbi:hypothetical protein [Massilia agri]
MSAAVVVVAMPFVVVEAEVERDRRADIGRVTVGGIAVAGIAVRGIGVVSSIWRAVDCTSTQASGEQEEDGKTPYDEHVSNIHGSLR